MIGAAGGKYTFFRSEPVVVNVPIAPMATRLNADHMMIPQNR